MWLNLRSGIDDNPVNNMYKERQSTKFEEG